MNVPFVSDEARAVSPRAFALELTKGCNLRCAYCYYAEREDAYDPRTRMSPEVARRSVDLLLAEGPAGEPVHLHFFGGEPLLNFSLLRETVLYGERQAASAGKEITFEVTTNGTRLTPEIVGFLNEHAVRVGVSFDGPPEIQDVARPAPKSAARGSSAMAEPGIRRLLESRRGTDLEEKTHCSVVLTRLSFDVSGIADYLEELGFRKIILTPATDLEGKTSGYREADLPRLMAAYEELAEAFTARRRAGREVAATWFPNLMGRLLSGEKKTHFCGGGRDYLGVSAEGEAYLCYRFFEDDDYAMGSVQEGIERGVTQELMDSPIDERTACGKCWARHFCGGGCHHDNLTTTGDITEPNPIGCELFRHSMDLTLDAWGRLSREGGSALTPRKRGEDRMSDRTPFETDAQPRSAPGCHVRELDGEKVVYDPASHEVCVLNATASLIFELCDGSRSVTDIVDALEREFDAPHDVLLRDIQATLTDLRAKNLVS